MSGGKLYLRGLQLFKTKADVQRHAKRHRTQLNNYAMIDKNEGGWFVWFSTKTKKKPKSKPKMRTSRLPDISAIPSKPKKKKLNIHPYDKFGLKPKKMNLNRTYLYHAVCQKNYRKEIYSTEPPVFVATEPKVAKEIVKMVHGCRDPRILKINIKGLPIYKDLYWENDDKQYKDEYSKFPEPAVMFMLRDMEQPIRKATENKIYYIPKRVVKERIK